MRNNQKRICLLVVGCVLLLSSCSDTPKNSGQTRPANTPEQTKNDTETEENLAYMNGERWKRSERVDQMDGHATPYFSSVAAGTREMNGTNPQFFAILCTPKPKVYFSTGPVESGDVRIKFDEAPPLREKWGGSSRDMLYPQYSAAVFVKKLLTAQTFKLEFTPRGEAPVIRTYKVSNLKNLLSAEPNCKI